jgi:hypothetical protein
VDVVVVASLMRRISFLENGDIGNPILCEMRLSSSFTQRFSDRVLENSPDDGASVPALHVGALPIDAASKLAF